MNGILCAALFAFLNPVIDADMSDPDCATADGTNFWLVTSSFTELPGLPLMHSTDLVNWRAAGHALTERPEACVWDRVGKGVWAPAIRFHDGLWHIFWGDPDAGIFRTTAADPAGVWSKSELVKPGKGLIDPCPFWDDDGSFHLIHAYAKSRAGINSVLAIDGKIVYCGEPDGNHTIEGPKLYRHDGYYWIFAPAGGVATGWQLAMRSKRLYGPYEWRIVLKQGSTAVNGPHQGAWVRKADGSDWFLHFQHKGWLGRVLHLQPMRWTAEGWPVVGKDCEPMAEVPGIDRRGDGPDLGWARMSPGDRLVTRAKGPVFEQRLDRGELSVIGSEIRAVSGTNLSVRLSPHAGDERTADVVFTVDGVVQPTCVISNSIWQGIRIGVAGPAAR